jgi:hypothetical protein
MKRFDCTLRTGAVRQQHHRPRHEKVYQFHNNPRVIFLSNTANTRFHCILHAISELSPCRRFQQDSQYFRPVSVKFDGSEAAGRVRPQWVLAVRINVCRNRSQVRKNVQTRPNSVDLGKSFSWLSNI